MNVQELIDLAAEKDPEFKRKITHRIHKRMKAPEFGWLFEQLTNILGEEFVNDAARKEVDKAREELKVEE